MTAPFAMPLALLLDMSFVLPMDMSFAKILVMILCHLLYHQLCHSLPIRYSIDMSLAISFATILVMAFCHLLYHQIYHWLFVWYVTRYCIGSAISFAICNAINFVINLKIVFDIYTISPFLAMLYAMTLNTNMALQLVNFIVSQ